MHCEETGQRWRATLLLVMALSALMVATRYHHFGSALHLPDASLAIFLAAGFYLRRWSWLVFFLTLAAGIDYFAVAQETSGASCISSAYFFLLPAYGVLWLGGVWLGRSYRGALGDIARLFLVATVATTLSFLVSNGSFYWLSGRVLEPDLPGYIESVLRYLPGFLGNTLLYLAVFAAIHWIIVIVDELRHYPPMVTTDKRKDNYDN